MALAVKELVENSIDAGAKLVEVKIRNYGEGGFEVVDNGSGIAEENFAGITAKHHTSKLKDFEDLESIKTFGFRGEALSSLCALSKVQISTRHGTTEHGTKLIYDHEGNITKRSICARNVGTTVSINDFFVTLPVRRGEFLKNYRKDFGKMVSLLQEYCLVLTGVKVMCMNQPSNGPRQSVLFTHGESVLQNIIAIFGAKQAKDLIKIESPLDEGTGRYTMGSLGDLESLQDVKSADIDNLNDVNFRIEGFISNIEHTARSAKDRQYFYINSRPVELKAISKLVNDTYHRYNLKQFPFVYINLKMEQSSVDVNLSKDKRQVAMCNDKIVQIAVRRALLNVFGELPTKFKLVSINSGVRKQADESEESEDDQILSPEVGSSFGSTLRQWKKTPDNPTPHSNSKKRVRESPNSTRKKQKFSLSDFMERVKPKNGSQSDNENSFVEENKEEDRHELSATVDDKKASTTIVCKNRKSEHTLKFEIFKPPEPLECDDEVTDNITSECQKVSPEKSITELEETFMLVTQTSTQNSDNNIPANQEESSSENLTPSQSLSIAETLSNPLNRSISPEIFTIDSQKLTEVEEASSKISTTIEAIRLLGIAEEKTCQDLEFSKKNRKLKLKFKESTIDPSKNKKAEAELETEIKKEMFSQMEILGQFNLGFIIAKLNSDLFIVDQHASDEKYNFENLEKSTRLQSQQLVVPEKFELSAIQEMTLIENLNVFEMNGFKFLVDHKADPGKKIRIHSKPYSKNWEFDKEDAEEMIFMLDNAPNTICRPSRIKSMLASRACRKSVMIGDPLTKKQMEKLVSHMGELDHPWNCPHGRPTLRYLQNLDFIDDLTTE